MRNHVIFYVHEKISFAKPFGTKDLLPGIRYEVMVHRGVTRMTDITVRSEEEKYVVGLSKTECIALLNSSIRVEATIEAVQYKATRDIPFRYYDGFGWSACIKDGVFIKDETYSFLKLKSICSQVPESYYVIENEMQFTVDYIDAFMNDQSLVKA